MAPMIDSPETYFRRFVPARSPLLKDLEEQARTEGVPIVGPVVGELLFVLAHALQARRILELGTATGYSAIYLGAACAAVDGRLITLEIDPAMAARARANLQQAGLEPWVEVREGDALAKMAALEGPFDMVFLDIEKRDYPAALTACRELIRKGGLLVADNIAFKGADGFNQAVAADPGWRAVHLLAFLPLHSPERDGLCLALRV